MEKTAWNPAGALGHGTHQVDVLDKEVEDDIKTQMTWEDNKTETSGTDKVNRDIHGKMLTKETEDHTQHTEKPQANEDNQDIAQTIRGVTAVRDPEE